MIKNLFMTLLVFSLCLSFSLLYAEEDKGELQKCPDFTLKNLKEDNVKFKSFLGKGPVFIDIWATWCKPCKKEMKELQKLYDKYKDDGFTVVAISIDFPKDEAKVKKYIKEKKYTFPVLLDPTQKAAKKLGAPEGIYPYSVITDSEGFIHFKHLGYNKGDEKKIEREIVSLLSDEKISVEKTEQEEATEEDKSE